MGPVDHLEIVGAKGGESQPKQAVEAPDSLRSTNIAKILLAVGEGEFDGVPTDRDIYLDNTPIADASGNVNFPGVKWEWRPGSVEQSYIQGIPSVENETSVNVELRSDNPFTRALSNTQLSAVRVRMSWPRLAKQESNGDTRGYRIEYAIDIATDGGAYVEAHLGAVDGKSTNGYQRSVRVNLPKATSGWMLRVRRLTPNANSGTVADTMTVAGYTEIIDQKIRYPNTALLYIEFDAQQFQNIPAVTVKCKAKRWPVPSTYDPITRTYSGVWDGTFKLAWTNNPAFVTYGLCVEDRFGLGKRIKPWMVDKWEMYRIAQYCDQLVPNGVGGQEPRFLCDMNLQGRAEAWTLLRDLSAIYRGMVYWAHGSLFMQADMPRAQDIDYVFTRSNVIDGEFVYGGAERSTHYSRALVSYDNPANNYDTDVIPVTDNALQRRYRDRPIELSAIGCTRASEAQRRGKWALLSNSQDRTVTFKTGMEGRIPLPGFVIPVADELVAGRPNGGRISSAAGRVVTLDRDTPIKAGDRLIVNLPNGTAQARTVHSVAGRAVTVTTEYSLQPEPELQWAIDYDDLAIQLFRVLKTTRTQEGSYEITALEFNPSKFAAIDTGAKLDERPISVIPVTTVAPPGSVSLSSGHMIDQGIAVSTMTIAWPAVAGAVAYDVEWRKDNGNWIRLQRTGAASVDVVGIYAGAYLARVRSVSAFDITSIWKSSNLTQLNGKEGLPPAVTFLATESLLFGIGIKWGLPAGAEDTERTELWYSEGTDLGAATKLADLAYPQSDHVMQGLRAGQRFFFWARLVDRSGNVGPFFPVAPTVVTGIASADASPILEQIKDQITESELGKELTSKIEKIALIDGNGPGSVNERIGTAKTELAKQISDVNNALGIVKGNLEQQITAVSADVSAAKIDLQQQIANVSALAGSLPYRKDKAYSVGQSALGSDGKLYQALKAVPLNTPPPNATYWTDVGQAVVTANGMAARVSKVETDVSTLDGKVTAQASQISGLQSSLTTTNGNVSAAQQAAQDAATLAGGKGKVIVQSAAPAVADRLAQNLWIDTTSNANTPKRWNGSAWVAVTDKVATDAAAAAQSALSQVALKADASVVTNLSTRVSDAEGKLSSQATRMDGMQTSIDGKASSQALQQVTSRVTATEDKDKAQDQLISSQSQALTSLTDSVSKKADASTVTQLANDVKAQGNTLSAQGSSLTKIETSLPSISGENLLANSSFEEVIADGTRPRHWAISGAAARAFVPSPLTSSLNALRISASVGAGNYIELVSSPADGRARVKVTAGATYTLSVYARGSGAPGYLRMYLQFLDAAGVVLSAPSTSGRPVLGENFTRYTLTEIAPANATQVNVYACRLINDSNAAVALWAEIDNVQLQEGVVATAYQPSILAAADVSAEAVTSLGARVEKTEQGLKSSGEQVTRLTNSLTITDGNVATAQQAAQAASNLAGSKGKVLVQSSAPAAADQAAQNLWIDTTGNANTPKRWNGSAWLAVTDKVATDAAAAAQNALNQLGGKADASALASLGSKVEQQGKDITAAGQSITRIDTSLTQVKSDTASNASATSALTGRVGATEAGLTSVSGQLTEVSNSIGDAGGENLFYNPAMTKYASLNGAAEGWQTEGSVSSVDTLVVSWLSSAEKALRIEVPSGLTTSGASPTGYKSLRPASSGSVIKRPKVAEGEPFTASAYARGTTGLACRIYLQWLNASGAAIGAPASTLVPLSPSSKRVEYSGVAVAGAVECNVYYRVFSITGAVSSGYMELARPKFEHGARATGWSDNGQVTGAEVSANSKAIDSLNSSVEQQGAAITAVASRTTQLETSVNSPVNGLATRASASAVEAISGRVSATENSLTSQSGQLVDLRNNLATVTSGLGAAGLDPAPGGLWHFDGALDVWYGQGANITLGAGFLTISSTSNDPQLISAAGLAIEGNAYTRIRVAITRRGGSGWDGQLFYSTKDHGFAGSYRKVIANPALAVGASTILEWDMANLTSGGADWTSSVIDRVRIDFGSMPSDVFEVDWIAIGRAAPSASSRALSSLDSKVTQQGDKIESEAKRTDGLYTSVGNANAAIQDEAKTRTNADSALSTRITTAQAKADDALAAAQSEVTARADADTALGKRVDTVQSNLGSTNASVQQISTAQTGLNNKVNASYSVRLQVVNGNQYVAAGFGVGVENNGDVLQSTFAVMADRFAVLNPSGNGFVSPFAIQNGQVFLNEAFISTATIQRAIVGNSISSSELANNGVPIMRMDFAGGTIIMQNKAATAYTVFNRSGIDMVINGVRRIRMGEW
ncbi:MULTISPECIES: phage tail protein [unclassified Pseudomonas]|uniref:phage tail protein n=1 Tax=Pseudomonas sp. LP_4_YM TaxID=2485135 RepID=UPI001051E54A|nr:putative phage tail protein [Pseudomonas sp. LP_4_YM]